MLRNFKIAVFQNTSEMLHFFFLFVSMVSISNSGNMVHLVIHFIIFPKNMTLVVVLLGLKLCWMSRVPVKSNSVLRPETLPSSKFCLFLILGLFIIHFCQNSTKANNIGCVSLKPFADRLQKQFILLTSNPNCACTPQSLCFALKQISNPFLSFCINHKKSKFQGSTLFH